MSTPLNMSRSRRAGAAAVLVALVLLASCGKGNPTSSSSDTTAALAETTTTLASGDASSTTAAPGPGGPATTAAAGAGTTPKPGAPATTAVKPTTTTLKPTASSADVTRAKGYLLTLNDVGAGYQKSDEPSSTDGTDFDKCGKGNPVFASNNPNGFNGDVFNKGASFADAAVVGSASIIGGSVAQASEAMSIAKTEEFLRCIEQTAKEAAAKRAPPGTTFDAKASRRPLTGGDDATGIHITVTGTYQAQRFTADIDALVYRKGATVALALVTVIGPSNAGEPARIGDIMKTKLG